MYVLCSLLFKTTCLSTCPRIPQLPAMTYSRFDAFTRGRVVGNWEAGATRKKIIQTVRKKDNSRSTVRAIDEIIAHFKKDPKWRGQDSVAGGRPRELTQKEQKQLVDFVFAKRGKAVVTVPYCKKRLSYLRRVTNETVRLALHRAGLAWLLRRMKRAVPKKYKPQRMSFSRWVKKQTALALRKWAYTDGATFYLARSEPEKDDKNRAALGRCVYRLASGKDGLWDSNVGPSCYAKAQGLPVKIWGVFANGLLQFFVLPADGPKKTKHMNSTRYNRLVKSKFAKWRRACFGGRAGRVVLVKDHEKCLWKKANLKAEREAGFDTLTNFPKCSPDLNAIEGWWKRLKQRLDLTAPEEIETRAAFIKRLRRTVAWLNARCQAEGRKLCRNQKVRAAAVLKLQGARCKW